MYALSLLSFILLADCTAQGEKEKKWTETLKIIRAGIKKWHWHIFSFTLFTNFSVHKWA